jgi:hypothetical protein
MPNRFSGSTLLLALLPAIASAQLVPGQIRTIDLPPSQPAPEASPVDPAPTVAEPAGAESDIVSDGLVLDLPTADEAGAEDVEAPVAAGAVDGDAASTALAAAEAVQLRTANQTQLDAARRQLDAIAADKQAERDRLARYREAQAAHAVTMAEYEAQLAADRAARARWEQDVVACRRGDRTRCAPPPPPAT